LDPEQQRVEGVGDPPLDVPEGDLGAVRAPLLDRRDDRGEEEQGDADRGEPELLAGGEVPQPRLVPGESHSRGERQAGAEELGDESDLTPGRAHGYLFITESNPFLSFRDQCLSRSAWERTAVRREAGTAPRAVDARRTQPARGGHPAAGEGTDCPECRDRRRWPGDPDQ